MARAVSYWSGKARISALARSECVGMFLIIEVVSAILAAYFS